eukprot:7720821-Alexandrium_andersonii.AAC.1
MSRAVAASCSHSASASADCATANAVGAGALARARRLLRRRSHKRARPSRPPVCGGAQRHPAAMGGPGARPPKCGASRGA